MAVTLEIYIGKVAPQLQRAIHLSTREAVNESALAVTQDARARVKGMLGSDGRLSGYLYNYPSGSRVGTAGGRLVYPRYKEAKLYGETWVALVGAIGPAQLIEHDRRGGYDIKPRRKGRPGGARQSSANAFIESMLGRPVEATGSGKAHAAALGKAGGDLFRAAVKGGFILRPQGGPIASAFQRAPVTIQAHAAQVIQRELDKAIGKVTV